jgi:hypothetical protein
MHREIKDVRLVIDHLEYGMSFMEFEGGIF